MFQGRHETEMIVALLVNRGRPIGRVSSMREGCLCPRETCSPCTKLAATTNVTTHDKRIIATVVPPGSQDSKTPRVTSFAGSDPVGRPVVQAR
jgi:hypothetical protein